MTEHLDPAATAQDLLDAMLPRKDPRYEAAHGFLSAHLATAPAIRRLALRALKASGATSPRAEEESKDAAAQGPAVSPVVDTAGRDPAGPTVDALPPEATGRAESGIGPGTAVAAGSDPASASITLAPEMGRQILLTRGLSALVDNEDYGRLNCYAWYATAPRGRTHYAYHDPPGGPPLDMARMVLAVPSGMEVDHVNGNGLDNRKCNLRLATHKQNTWNRRKHVDNQSGFKGVSFTKRSPNLQRPWAACLFVSGRRIFLGRFATAEEAARAYDVAAIEHCGEFASINFSAGKRARI